MSRNLTLIHCGWRCPWIPWFIAQGREASRSLGAELKVIDASRDRGSASHYRLYFPFMTLIDDTIRLPSPMPTEELLNIAQVAPAAEDAVQEDLSEEAEVENVDRLNVGNIHETFPLCIHGNDREGCAAKTAWARELSRWLPEGVLGFVGRRSGQVVSCVEFLPSMRLCYPLPHRDHALAVITCIYGTENGLDYRSGLLEPLVSHLVHHGFNKLQVIAGERTSNPNGPAGYFKAKGFREVSRLDRVLLREGWEQLILMELALPVSEE